MSWSPDPDALRGRVAVVAGATRGAGRGIAAALGEAGATVICTGRSSSVSPIRSDYDRAETIEETADLVTRLGGTGVAIAGGTAVAVTPGWLRSEIMLEHFQTTEENWRAAAAPPDFALSESPRYVGRAVAAMASDPDRARWNQRSVTSGQLAKEYGFTDVDGSRPDIWRFIEEIRERGLNADHVDADHSHADYSDYR
jgi:NAD(P)-dependent dehydrogenase (short-subunit alcohol dehydrogenase family)